MVSEDNYKCQCLCEIADELFVALLDTGATICVGSKRLFSACLKAGIAPTPETEDCFAVGGAKLDGPKFRVRLPVEIFGRTFLTTFTLFPLENFKVILGMDFLTESKMVLEPYLDCWHFSDAPSKKYKFVTNVWIPFAPSTSNQAMDLETLKLSPQQMVQTMAVNFYNLAEISKNCKNSEKKSVSETCNSNFKVQDIEIVWKDIFETIQRHVKEDCNRPSTSSDWTYSRPLTKDDDIGEGDDERNDNSDNEEKEEQPLVKKHKSI